MIDWLDLIKGVMPVVDRYLTRVGLWQTQIAQLNEVVHLWVYRDLNERAAARAKRGEDPEWQAFLAKSAPLLAHMHALACLHHSDMATQGLRSPAT